MKDELLIQSYSDTNILILLPKKIGNASDVYLPLKEIYTSGNLQNNAYIFSSEFGGYYHIKLNFLFSIPTLLDLADQSISIFLNSYINGIFKGSIKRIEYLLDSSGVVTNTSDLTQEIDFEIFFEKGSHFNVAFTHDFFKSVPFTISSVEIKVYEIADKKTVIPTTLIHKTELDSSLQNYMQSGDFVNPDGTVGVIKPVALEEIKGLPSLFPPEFHEHSDLVKEDEFLEFRDKIINYLNSASEGFHTHGNMSLLNGFYLDGELLYFKGRRFMTFSDFEDISAQENLKFGLRELSDLHYDVLNFPPEEYFYDKGNVTRWEATIAQDLFPNVWSTVVFSAVEVIRGDLVSRVARVPPLVGGEWRFYPQVPGTYVVNFLYLFEYQTIGGVTGDRSDVRYGLFRNGVLYSILDYKWLTLTELLSGFHRLRDSGQGTDKIVLKLGDYINIKIFHNYALPLQPPGMTKSYGYIDIERVDTISREISPTNIPEYLA